MGRAMLVLLTRPFANDLPPPAFDVVFIAINRPNPKGGRSMLNLWGTQIRSDCEGTSRRDFLRIGALGMSGLTLPALLRLRSAAAGEGRATKDTSVVWIWLGGGPTHIETFDPKMDAPAEFRSMVGAVKTSVPGIQIGSLLPGMAK